MLYRADFHLHSCLSPCASLDMAPSAIVRTAAARGLTALALTDHNSARNCPAFAEHCRRAGMAALLGMEVNTQEETHVLCLFDRLDRVMDFDAWLTARLPSVAHCPERFGDQVYVNADDEIEGEIAYSLFAAASVTLDELARAVHAMDGLVIPAHVDRSCFSLSSQLGFVPDGPFDAVEVTPKYDRLRDPLRLAARFPLLSNSDAHELSRIGAVSNELDIPAWNIAALRGTFRKMLLETHSRQKTLLPCTGATTRHDLC